MSSRARPLLDLDPATVRRARSAGPPGRQAGRRPRPQPHDGVRRARDAAPRRAVRGRPRERPVGQPPRRRGPRRGRPRARRHDPGLGRAAPRRGPRPADPRAEVGQRRGLLPPPRGQGRHRAPARRRAPSVARGIRDRSTASAPPATASCAGYGDPPQKPWIYLIVATGDIYEDIPQAQTGRPRGRRRHRRDPLDRAEPARLRARGRHPRGVRRHLRHPGELPADAGGPRRVEQGARPLRAAHQLRERAVHARDRGPRRPRAARHDAQRLDVRHPLPRHQPDPHLRRPALQPPGPRPRRDHHQHRRGQLPHHRGCRRGGPHGHGEPAAQRVLRQGGRSRGLAARPRPRLRDQPRAPRQLPARAGPRTARAASSSRTRR